MNLHRKAQKAGKKRAARERAGQFNPARSSDSSRSGEIKSVSLDLYRAGKVENGAGNGTASTNGAVTSRTLSKKRAKKIERNLKYAEQRRLLTDLTAKLEDSNEGMEIDAVGGGRAKKVEKKTALGQVKEALWNVIEDSSSQGLVIGSGQGTTLGGPMFP